MHELFGVKYKKLEQDVQLYSFESLQVLHELWHGKQYFLASYLKNPNPQSSMHV